MSTSFQLRAARLLLRRFTGDARGNIAVMFSIALVPMLIFTGSAVDYTRASTARSAMQSALDSAALMVSKDNAAGTLSSSALTTKGQAYFNALYTNKDASNIVVTAAYSNVPPNGQRVTMTGSGSVTTAFMKIAGYPTMGINTSSTTTWGTTKLRVALALDNTGSMQSDGKMSALQTASKNLIDQLSASAQNADDVMISIVPFANVVNLGTSFKSSGYIDWSNWSMTASLADHSDYDCGSNNRAPSYDRRGNLVSRGVMKCGTASNNVNNWNGCVMDRGPTTAPGTALGPDVLVTAPTTSANYFPADQSSYCPTQIVPLSYNWTSLKATIDAMSPSGGTNQPIGMVWGWQTLKQTSPMNAPAEDSNYTYTKAIILLSDGLNTMDRWYGDGSSYSVDVDNRQKLLCDNIKADGVTIYTIQVNTGGDPTSSILSYCASGTSNFYMLTTANQVISTFNTIGTSLTKLRIAQ